MQKSVEIHLVVEKTSVKEDITRFFTDKYLKLNVLLDEGSHQTYLSTKVVNELKMKKIDTRSRGIGVLKKRLH